MTPLSSTLTYPRRVAPAGSGLPDAVSAAAVSRDSTIPTIGIPVLVLRGPIPMRAALGIVEKDLLVRPLAPLMPSTRLHGDEITAIDVEVGHWYALGRTIVSIRRVRGQTLRLMAPPIPGVPDGTENLGRLLRAWWRSGHA